MDVRELSMEINSKRKSRKPRKMRLLADIYATTERSTIEDLERRNWIGSSTPTSENLNLDQPRPSRLTKFQDESGPSSEPDQNLGFKKKKRKLIKRKHAEYEEDSFDDCDILLSTIRKMSCRGKRRKLIITDWESDDDDDTNTNLLDLPISQVSGSLIDLLETKFSNMLISTKPPPQENKINSELSNGNEESVLRLTGRNLIVDRPQMQVSGTSSINPNLTTRQFSNGHTESFTSAINRMIRGPTNGRFDLPIHNLRATQQTPNTRFSSGGLFVAQNIQLVMQVRIYQMRNDNRIMAGSELGYLYGGGGSSWNRLHQMREHRILVPMTPPTMEMNNYLYYNYRYYSYQAPLPPPAAFPYSHFQVAPQMETTVANTNPRARFNGFTTQGASSSSSSLQFARYLSFPSHQGPRFYY